MLVFQGGLDPEYVLDRMTLFELHILVARLYMAHKDSWEQTRETAFISAKIMGGTKAKDPVKFMPLPWDSQDKKILGDSDSKVTSEDINRLKQKAKNYLNNGTGFSNKN